ncbi:GL20419 [Drosophila persimilis]|uniref:GL20419 n=1 Tax=Drosophila persimilis TaxID=7234 RepID=B4GY55_DROPE|nr:GL20419 [Drosophila persimilis]
MTLQKIDHVAQPTGMLYTFRTSHFLPSQMQQKVEPMKKLNEVLKALALNRAPIKRMAAAVPPGHTGRWTGYHMRPESRTGEGLSGRSPMKVVQMWKNFATHLVTLFELIEGLQKGGGGRWQENVGGGMQQEASRWMQKGRRTVRKELGSKLQKLQLFLQWHGGRVCCCYCCCCCYVVPVKCAGVWGYVLWSSAVQARPQSTEVGATSSSRARALSACRKLWKEQNRGHGHC